MYVPISSNRLSVHLAKKGGSFRNVVCICSMVLCLLEDGKILLFIIDVLRVLHIFLQVSVVYFFPLACLLQIRSL